jgi:hypothetical protein
VSFWGARAIIAVMNTQATRSRFLLVPDPKSASAGESRPKVRRYSLTRLQAGAQARVRAGASPADSAADAANIDSL